VQKEPKKFINRSGQLILTIANWKITKNPKEPSSLKYKFEALQWTKDLQT
jgi:hypothetical protein